MKNFGEKPEGRVLEGISGEGRNILLDDVLQKDTGYRQSERLKREKWNRLKRIKLTEEQWGRWKRR